MFQVEMGDMFQVEMGDMFQDGMDEFFADDDTKVYWVSFLDGLQRMLLFTEDLAVAANAQEVINWSCCLVIITEVTG